MIITLIMINTWIVIGSNEGDNDLDHLMNMLFSIAIHIAKICDTYHNRN